jgi:hypothetical protein
MSYDEPEGLVTCAGPNCNVEFLRFPANKKYCSPECKRDAENDRRSAYSFTTYDQVRSSYQFDTSDEIFQRNEFLRKENARLLNAHDKYKNSYDEAFDLIMKTVKENVQSIQIPFKKEQNKNLAKRPELVFNPWNSDTQIGKVTPTYNTQKAYENVELYTDYIIEHYNDFSQLYNINKAHVYFLGDIVEGENIFPTQPHLIDTSVFRQATVDGPQMYGQQLRRLLEKFEHVRVVCVIGNHGRLGRYSNPESNMDRVLYQTLYWMFHDEPRIEFVIPQGHGESMFWAVDSIGDYSTLLIHGDQLGPPSTQNTYAKKIPSWKAGGIPTPFNDVAMGHYHQNVKLTLGDTVVRISGSPESYNTFAQERLGVMGRPSQHLQIVDPKSGVFWESDIYLD